MNMTDCTVLIPARIGSKRIPNKNFKPLHPDGRCAVQLAVDCALYAGFRNIVVSTDWPGETTSQGAPIAVAMGVPFLAPVVWDWRPSALAQDDTPMIETVKYLIERFVSAAYVLLQPTQPLRQPKHLRRALDLLDLDYSPCDSVVSIGLDRFVRDGTVYVFWKDTVERYGTIYGKDVCLMPIPATETCPLDTPAEWAEAERRLRT